MLRGLAPLLGRHSQVLPSTSLDVRLENMETSQRYEAVFMALFPDERVLFLPLCHTHFVFDFRPYSDGP